MADTGSFSFQNIHTQYIIMFKYISLNPKKVQFHTLTIY